jgi:tetratricopeptide (TPR) repeat protein
MRNLILALFCLSPAARADPSEEARRHWQEGTVAYALGRFPAAAAEYEEAFASRPLPELLYNAAQAHRFAGNKRRALLLYQSYLSTPLFARRPMAERVERHIEVLRAALEREEQSLRGDLAPAGWPARAQVAGRGAATVHLERRGEARSGAPGKLPPGPAPLILAAALIVLAVALLALSRRRRTRPARLQVVSDEPRRKTLELSPAGAVTLAGRRSVR